MGEWLSNKEVPFKCIQYTPFNIEYEDKKYEYIDFSVVFDRNNSLSLPLITKTQSIGQMKMKYFGII